MMPPVVERSSLVAPLSLAQQRMWLFAQLEPGHPLYHQLMVTRWRGRLDQAALERSLSELIRRHQTLRATFEVGEEDVVQRVHEGKPAAIPVEHMAGMPALVREEAALRRARALWRLPFDLAQGPLLRGTLLRLEPDHHLLVLVLHHLAGDGWSTRVLDRELAALYGAFAAGAPAPLDQPGEQYLDFVVWQRDRLSAEAMDQELEYWREHLRGAPPALVLPADRPRLAHPSYAGGRVAFPLSGTLVERLAELGRSERATLFMTLFGAFLVQLRRWSGQADLVVGVPVAARTRVELENTVGCFANTLVLRTDLTGDPTFRQLLRRVRAVTLEGYARQDLPFELVVQSLQPDRVAGVHPLFQVMFNFRDFRPQDLDQPGMEIRKVPIYPDRAFVDLSLELDRNEAGFEAALVYDVSRFDRPTIERFAADYRAVLGRIREAMDQPISSLGSTVGADAEATAQLLDRLERLSEDDARRLLAETEGELLS